MYCSTCGAYVAEHRSHCTECGTRIVRPEEPLPTERGARPSVPERPAPPERHASVRPSVPPRHPFHFGREDRRWMVERSVGVCPRCTYRGEGLPYFSRGVHVAALVGATVVTSGAVGVGGIAYYLMRRDHRVCPRCGKGWGRYGERSLAPTQAAAQPSRERIPRAGRESGKRFGSVLLWVFAVILLISGIASAEIAAVLFGLAAGAGGYLLQRAANAERETRRAALLANLQLEVLRLARERRGRLTVTEVATALGWPLRRAEKVLMSLDDGLRVNSEVTDEGVIVYEFLEVMHLPPQLTGQEPDVLPPGEV